ncbi:Omp28-related outer membrane protein [bacterium]|nr:Omp28-related outer membrane protein [bacterium]
MIEDFTGHRCKNCPKASKEIAKIDSLLPGRSVAVAIHAGSDAFTAPDSTNGYPTEFRTPEGEVLKQFFRVSFQPAGMVSRLDYSSSGAAHLKLFNSWPSWVAQINLEPATIELEIDGTYNDATRVLSGAVTSTLLSTSNADLRICLWLCESDIVAPQLLPDDTRDPDYVHHNVFRTSLNTAFGTILSPNGGSDGQSFDTPFNYAIPSGPEGYTAENCKLVVFVYDNATQEVLQAEEVEVGSL